MYLLIASCDSHLAENNEERYKILSLLIDEFGKPIIPPNEVLGLPPFSEQQIDSIHNQKLNIGIYPVLQNVSSEFKNLNSYDDSFHALIRELAKDDSNLKIEISNLRLSKPYNPIIVDTIQLKNDRYYIKDNYDKLITFSNIAFDENLQKAAIVISVNMGPLNGISSLVLLEKKKDLWYIKSSRTFLIS